MTFVVDVSDVEKSTSAWIQPRNNSTHFKANDWRKHLRERIEFLPPSVAMDLERETKLMQNAGVELYERKLSNNTGDFRQALRNLLFAEESEYSSQVDKFNQSSDDEKFFFQVNNHRCFKDCEEWELKVDDPSTLSERRPSLSVGDKITAWTLEHDDHLLRDLKIDTRKYDGVDFVGYISKIKQESILVQMPLRFSVAYKATREIRNNTRWSARFEMQENDRLRFRKYHHAIDVALESKVSCRGNQSKSSSDTPLFLDPLFWETPDFFFPGRSSLTGNSFKPDACQQSFISTILRLSHPKNKSLAKYPVLLSGPFGTGKTATLIETTLRILIQTKCDSRIYICTETNSAADLYVERLHEIIECNEKQGLKSSFHRDEIFRLLSPNRPRDQCFQGTDDKETFLSLYTKQVSEPSNESVPGMFAIPERSFLENKRVSVCYS
jgi:hypothetical protein